MKPSVPKLRYFIIAGAIALISMAVLRLLGDCFSFGILGHWVNFKAFEPMEEIVLPLLSLFLGFLLGGLMAGILESLNKESIELGTQKSYILITVGSVICYLALKSWFF
ncbi:MAG: hypothetical protein KDE26_29610 [Bacteroidetes bacterium]|nr:hypothetical protein [Bacteroidota bacterium]MCB0847458.1 hypothetical protein [Bacteroidota bacterium]